MDPLELLGAWDLSREIEDRRGDDLTVTGTADFSREPDGRIRWHEYGTMHLPSGQLPFQRTMFLVRTPSAGPAERAGGQDPTTEPAERWHVTFDDGRLFHAWPGTAHHAGPDLVHVCTPDLYTGRFSTHPGGAAWTLTWSVSGPRKDYVMTTDYRRP
jgi:hypothetical protein